VLVVPPKGGRSPNPSGLSKERRELVEAIERSEVPRVMEMLHALFVRGIEGDDIAAKLWLDQVRGPVKARDDDAIARAAEEKLLEMLQEARRRRALETGRQSP
jgi:hypothetical protein